MVDAASRVQTIVCKIQFFLVFTSFCKNDSHMEQFNVNFYSTLRYFMCLIKHFARNTTTTIGKRQNE